jgi:uncharacterized glyoxalase superfamily protein PhnB
MSYPVVPMVSYEDCDAAAEWLCRAFGFSEVERFEEDGVVAHVTLQAGEGRVFLGNPGAAYIDPVRLREQSDVVARMHESPFVVDGVFVRVGDATAHREKAIAEGARALSEIEQGPVGDLYRVEDPFGHRWMFASG